MEAGDLGAGAFQVALLRMDEGGGADGFPLGAQGFDDGGEDEPLDVGARGVVGAELVAFLGIEGALEQGAEDGGLDVFPLHGGGFDQDAELGAIEREDAGVFEEAAVEAEELLIKDDGKVGAGLHLGKELAELGDEAFGGLAQAFEQAAEAVLGQQAHVFGKHAEEAAGEELGDELGRVFLLFERTREDGEVAGDFAGDFGADFRRVERERVEPDAAETLADGGVAEIIEAEAEAARIGISLVGAASLGEVGIDLDAVADIDDEEEGRGRFVGGEVAGVALGLAFGAPHGVVPCRAVADGAGFLLSLDLGAGGDGGEREIGLLGFRRDELLRLQHEAAAAVEIEAAIGGEAGAGGDLHRELEGIAAGVAILGARDAEEIGQLGEEELGIGALAGRGHGPTGEEGFEGGMQFSRSHGAERAGRAGQPQGDWSVAGRVLNPPPKVRAGATPGRDDSLPRSGPAR